MIDREDMLALTRRMTVKRTSMTRIAGGYMDSDGCIDGTFNIAFLKLSPANREKNLQIAKKVSVCRNESKLCKNTNCRKICKMTACGNFDGMRHAD